MTELEKIARNAPGESDLSGPHAYADDTDLFAKKPQTLEEMANHVDIFCQMTNLKVNTGKTAYHANSTAHARKELAQVRIQGEEIKPSPEHEAFKLLGVWFNMNLDWQEHCRRMSGALYGMIDAIKKRKLTQTQLVEVINVMMIQTLTYGMMVVEFRKDLLLEMDNRIERLVARHSHLYGNHLHDSFRMNREDGGLGLHSLKCLQDAAIINNWLAVINGPDSPAKTALRRIERQNNAGETTLKIHGDTPLNALMRAIKRQGMKLNTTLGSSANEPRKKQKQIDHLREIIRESEQVWGHLNTNDLIPLEEETKEEYCERLAALGAPLA